MARSRPEWIGKSDDTRPPPRIRQRIYDRDNGTCHICKLPIKPGETWHADHVIALIEGGENRESNLQAVSDEAHAGKTKAEARVRAKINRQRLKNAGVKSKKARPMAGSKASRFKRTFDGTVNDRRTGEVI